MIKAFTAICNSSSSVTKYLKLQEWVIQSQQLVGYTTTQKVFLLTEKSATKYNFEHTEGIDCLQIINEIKTVF